MNSLETVREKTNEQIYNENVVKKTLDQLKSDKLPF